MTEIKIDGIQEKYKGLLTKIDIRPRDLDGAYDLRNLVGEEPTQETMDAVFLHHISNFNSQDPSDLRGVVSALERFSEPMPESTLQRIYANLIKAGNIGSVQALAQFKPKPDVDEELVQNYFTSSLDHLIQNPEFEFKRAISLKDIIAIVPNLEEAKVQAAYARIFSPANIENSHRDHMKNAKLLHQATGLKPAMPESDVQEAYSAIFRRGNLYFASYSANLLNKLTGIAPQVDESLVKEIYKDFLIYHGAHSLKVIFELTGIKPEFDEADLQRYYGDHIGGNMMSEAALNNAKDVEEITGIPISDETIQAIYLSYLDHLFDQKWVNCVQRLKDFIGIAPSEETVQAAYKKVFSTSYFSKGDIDFARNIKWFSGIHPDEEPVQELYRNELTRTIDGSTLKFEELLSLKRFTGLEPKLEDELIQKAYERFFTPGKYRSDPDISNARVLRELTGVTPSQDLAQRFIDHYIQQDKYGNVRMIKDFVESE